jgi:VIT family
VRPLHREIHLVERIGWLRAAVLGANDGIISTASLILGVAAAAATKSDILLAGVAGLVADAMSMAAGEYVSVSSQSDTEQANLARERRELLEVQRSRKTNRRKSTSIVAWNPNSLGRLRFSLWPKMHWGRMARRAWNFGDYYGQAYARIDRRWL